MAFREKKIFKVHQVKICISVIFPTVDFKKQRKKGHVT